MSNYINNNYTEINDLSQIFCNTINTSTVTNDEFNALQGISTISTIQEQIDAIIYGNNPGGYFSIQATQNTGFVASSYWGFNSGTNPTVNIPLVFAYPFRIIGISITTQSTPTTAATVRIFKNGASVYEMTNINSTLKTFSNLSIDFAANETFNIFTVSGSGGGLVRATISCEVDGVIGAKGDTGAQGATGQNGITPNFTIGTVTNLSSGSNPTVTLSGNQANPILNFGLVQGEQGAQGAQGQKGDKGDKGDTGSISAATQAQIDANTAGLVTLGGTVATIAGDVATLDTTVSGLVTDVTAINADIDALEGKTQYITTNQSTTTTQINSNFQVTVGVNASSFKVDTTTGNLDNTGDIRVRNSAGSTTINLSNDDGTITANTLNCSAINCDSVTSTGLIKGSNITSDATSTTLSTNTTTNTNILGSNIYLGSFASTVYVNNVPLVPFSSASSFFNGSRET